MIWLFSWLFSSASCRCSDDGEDCVDEGDEEEVEVARETGRFASGITSGAELTTTAGAASADASILMGTSTGKSPLVLVLVAAAVEGAGVVLATGRVGIGAGGGGGGGGEAMTMGITGAWVATLTWATSAAAVV